jgi:L-ascorbate metabolism protein UlaG (beta-lactamase superfamily)
VRADAAASGPHPPRLAATWLGHSTALLELDGVMILTDPVLRERVAHLTRTVAAGHPRRLTPDLVLISHAHWDHLDRRSLRLVSRDAHVVVPRGLGRKVARIGFHDVVELVEGMEVELAGVEVEATHAEHGRRALGYLLRGSTTAYFAGDTDLFDGMASLEPELDLALLPVSGWGPRLPPGHLDPAGAARALQLLEPRVAVPIHWGTFRPFYKRTPYDTDAGAGARFAALARELAPDVDVRVLRPGERAVIRSG